MMNANLDYLNAPFNYYDSPDYTDSYFPNDTFYYDNIFGIVSYYNPFVNQTEENFNNFSYIFVAVISITALVISMFGAVGNGIVIWLLGFRIKRNPFSTYILNLAIADLGVLLSALLGTTYSYIYHSFSVMKVFFHLFLLMFSASQFLLTAISIDRCVAVFFSIWYRCHRPPHLSTIVCAVIWVLLTAVAFILLFFGIFIQLVVNAVLCLPVMMIATVALFIKVCLKARQHWRGKCLAIVMLTLLFFLLFAFPYNVIYILSYIGYLPQFILLCALLLACLNSSINPVIYFLVGRQWKSRRRESVKMIFQKVFKEEDFPRESPVETQL